MLTTEQQRREFTRASRGEIDRWQLDRLNQLLDTILPANSFYAKRLAAIRRPLASLECLAELPLTTKDDLIAGPDNGDQVRTLTYAPHHYTRRHQTSGTHGRPLVLLDTDQDWQWWLDCWQYVLDAAQITTEDRLFAAFSFGPFIGFWTAFESASQRGAMVIPGGGMTTSARLETICLARATGVFCTPSYALHLAEVAQSEGIDLRGSAVRAVIVAGEPGGSVPNVRQRIEQAFDAEVIDHGGATEIGAWGFADADRRGLLVNEHEFIAEFIVPKTGQPAQPGEISELVITNLGRHGAPVIRYRTGDLVRPTWNDDQHTGFVLLDGGILARCDEMMIVRGVNIFPSAIDQILRAFPEVIEYRTTVSRAGEMDQLTVEIEDETNQPARIEDAFRTQLGLRVAVQVVPAGTLPRFEAKAKRFKDARKPAG